MHAISVVELPVVYEGRSFIRHVRRFDGQGYPPELIRDRIHCESSAVCRENERRNPMSRVLVASLCWVYPDVLNER